MARLMHIFKLDQMGTNPKKHWEVENAQCLDTMFSVNAASIPTTQT